MNKLIVNITPHPLCIHHCNGRYLCSTQLLILSGLLLSKFEVQININAVTITWVCKTVRLMVSMFDHRVQCRYATTPFPPPCKLVQPLQRHSNLPYQTFRAMWLLWLSYVGKLAFFSTISRTSLVIDNNVLYGQSDFLLIDTITRIHIKNIRIWNTKSKWWC